MRGLRTRIEIDINNNIELVSRAILQKMESLISALFSNHLVACSSTCNAVGIGPSAPSLFLLGLRLYHVSGWVAAPVPVPPAHIRQSFDSLLGEEPALPLPQRPIQGKINVCDWVIARLESGSGKIVL